MTDSQWNTLLSVVRGEPRQEPPIGFIIDSPWLPNWYGRPIIDYFASEEVWFQANLAAIEAFPDVIFLPGFWSEYGMCTEPSAFGVKCVFYHNEFPFADKLITDSTQIDSLTPPNPETDGLLPFMLRRLTSNQSRIEALGHKIRFSVSRGPLNVATFLMGTTEFLILLKTEPDRAHQLLRVITEFLKRWHALQREALPSISGIMMLDDIVGFLGEADFLEFGAPYLRELYSGPGEVKFFHNDAKCASSIAHYAGLGINLYNPGVFNSLEQLRSMSGGGLTILGNIPPRDVLASGSPETVRNAVAQLLAQTPDKSRLVLSCAGGMPPGVSTANLRAFIAGAKQGI